MSQFALRPPGGLDLEAWSISHVLHAYNRTLLEKCAKTADLDNKYCTLSLVSLNSKRESKTHWTPGRESNDFLNKYFLGKCTIAIGDSDNGIITTLYSGSNGVCNPEYQLSSRVRFNSTKLFCNLTSDES